MTLPTSPTGALPGSAPRPRLRGLAASLALTVMLTTVSLLITGAIAFDPEGWIVWAREVAGPGFLSTQGGPAWKPLPVLLIAPFTWVSRGEADVFFWLFIARAGTVLAALSVAAIAHRIAGRAASLLAGLLIIVSPWWFYNGMLGNAEPLLVALLAGTVLAYDTGRVRVAGVLAVAASLVRPEIWPFALLFGVWLCHGDRRRVPWLLGAVAIVLVGWLVPELLHSGGGALDAARGKATASSARYAAVPFLAVFKDTFTELTPLAGVLALVGLLTVGRDCARSARAGGVAAVLTTLHLEWAITAAGLAYVLIVALMSEIGFAGNPRYLIPALAALTITAAVTGTRLAAAVTTRLRANARRAAVITSAGVVLVVGVALATQIGTLRTQERDVSGHARIASLIQRQLTALHCPRLAWTFAANRTTLAQLADQDVGQSGHPPGFHPRAGDFVSCAPTWWTGIPDR